MDKTAILQRKGEILIMSILTSKEIENLKQSTEYWKTSLDDKNTIEWELKNTILNLLETIDNNKEDFEYKLQTNEYFWKREMGIEDEDDETVQCPECGIELDIDDISDIGSNEEMECFACGYKFNRI